MLRVLKIYFKIYNDFEDSRRKVHNKNLKSALFIKKSTIHNKNLKSTLFTNLISLRLRRRDKICDSSKITILLQSHRVLEGSLLLLNRITVRYVNMNGVSNSFDYPVWCNNHCHRLFRVANKTVIGELLVNAFEILVHSVVGLANVLELKWIWVSSIISATSELWHALDMLLMWILNKVAPNTIPLRDFKREMPKSQNQSLGRSRCAY